MRNKIKLDRIEILMNRTCRLGKHFRASKKCYEARQKIRELLYDKEIPAKKRKCFISILNKIETMRCLLDDHYHDIITDSEFSEWGHIYYDEKGERDRKTKPVYRWPGRSNASQNAWIAQGLAEVKK